MKIFGEVINVKPQAGFELRTYRLVVDPLTHCAMLLGDDVGKESTFILTPYCFSINNKSQHGGGLYFLN